MKYDGSRRAAAAVSPQRVAARFWPKVEKTATCWLWRAALHRSGYGWCRAFNRATFAHRVAWKLTHGEWPTTILRHTCDTPACVNPAHLLLGTQADNIRDMVDRNRAARGESRSRLTTEHVMRIRELVSSGQTLRAVAAQFSISESQVSRIARGVQWAHLPVPGANQ